MGSVGLRWAIFWAILLSLASDAAGARQYGILHDFQFPPQGLVGGVVADGSGTLFGYSFSPGAIYSLKSDGSGFSVLHTFLSNDAGGVHPNGTPVLDDSGRLYGTTEAAVFSIKTDGSDFTILHSFGGGPTDGDNARAALILDGAGDLFGTTEAGGGAYGGTIFRIGTDGTGFAVIHSFSGGPTDGLNPVTALLWDGAGGIYGTTTHGGPGDGGTIFATTTEGGQFAILHSFDVLANNDQSGPSSLILDSSGSLYGTTPLGGSANLGTVFSIKQNGTAFTVLHSFAGSPSDGANPYSSLLLDSSGSLYGTTVNGGNDALYSEFGTVFRMRPDGSSFSVLHMFKVSDGEAPDCPLILDGSGHLFGTTSSGGLDSMGDTMGVVFSLAIDGSDFKILHTCPLFAPEGVTPDGSLALDSAGVLYGSASRGGLYNRGTLFRIGSDGSAFKVIHVFTGGMGYVADGDTPVGSLVMDDNGYLYGVTSNGGSGRVTNAGTIFKVGSDGKGFFVLHSFGNSFPVDGELPQAGLVLDDTGTLYGTASIGGSFSVGIVFKIKTDGTGFSVLHSFAGDGSEGESPQAPLAVDSAGNLFGTTGIAIFVVRTDGTGFKVIHSFSGPDGASVYAGVTLDGLGNLYGTASAGGTFNGGTIFRMRTDGSAFQVLHSFDGATDEGISPRSSVLLDTLGNLYGTTREGPGSIFTITASGEGFKVLHAFGGPPDGELSTTAVISDSFGDLYGVAPMGGSGGGGVVFKLPPIFLNAVPRPIPEPIPGRRPGRSLNNELE